MHYLFVELILILLYCNLYRHSFNSTQNRKTINSCVDLRSGIQPVNYIQYRIIYILYIQLPSQSSRIEWNDVCQLVAYKLISVGSVPSKDSKNKYKHTLTTLRIFNTYSQYRIHSNTFIIYYVIKDFSYQNVSISYVYIIISVAYHFFIGSPDKKLADSLLLSITIHISYSILPHVDLYEYTVCKVVNWNQTFAAHPILYYIVYLAGTILIHLL